MIRLLAMIGNWVAGLGAIAAVAVSLWLARRSEKLRLRVKVDRVRVEREEIRYVRDGEPVSKIVNRDQIIFSVTNRGSRTETIESVGWAHRKGLERVSEIIQYLGSYRHPYYRLEPGANHKVVMNTTKAIAPLPESPKWVRGIVHTPMGSKAVRVGPELRKYFREERRAKRKIRHRRNRKVIPTSSDDEPSAPLRDAPSDVEAEPPRDDPTA